jgi:bifunctional non-homologous end joining protein LigD
MAKRGDALATYKAKRRFDETPEPSGGKRSAGGDGYLIQKHAATRLHYDFRLELDGVLLSWAVTRGPSLDPAVKRLAVRTEDHPLDYASFEGRIPKGNYGAGTVLLWDRGTWAPIGDPHEGLRKGKLAFHLYGERLQGRWALVRFRGQEKEKRENWLLIKEKDEYVDRDSEITEEHTRSVASGREMTAIADAPDAVWQGESKAAHRKRMAKAESKAATKSDRRTGARSRTPSPSTAKSKRATTSKAKARKGKRSPLPRFVGPALATLVSDMPADGNWLYEVKFDGYRAIAAVSGESVRIFTRNGLDWTKRYPAIAASLATLGLDGALLDGEIVVVDDDGRTDFGALQNALESKSGALSYFVFDLLADGGEDRRKRPLLERKAQLKTLLGTAGRKGPVFYTDHVDQGGEAMLATLCEKGFEGLIAKRPDAPYRSGRGLSWLKVKCGKEQEFVIVGWADSDKGRPFASILLGLREKGALRYVGKVGSGFSGRELRDLSKRFKPIAKPPVSSAVPRAILRRSHWIEPTLVAEIEFAGFTRDGLIRQGRFKGLREDKPAKAIVRERALPVGDVAPASGVVSSRRAAAKAKTMPKSKRASTKTEASAGDTLGIRLTHPERVLFPEQGITKLDLARYLDAVSDRMLPYVANRLLTLVRCPEGRTKSCFYQRHASPGMPDGFHEQDRTKSSGETKGYVYIDGKTGLLGAAQLGVLELHIWGSPVDDIEHPDRMVFDLDPDPSVDFAQVREGAYRLRDVLEALRLESFALVTGGKGVHVVVPLQRKHDWETVKAFTRAVSEKFVEDDPARYVATMRKAKRKGKVFIDFFRNDRTATAIAPYSMRKHPGAPLAWPVTWQQLGRIASADHFRMEMAARELKKPDPWQGYFKVKQSIRASALKALGL